MSNRSFIVRKSVYKKHVKLKYVYISGDITAIINYVG